MTEKVVPVTLPDGTPGTAPVKAAKQIVAEGGRVMSAEEAAATQASIDFQQHYDPLKHPLNAIGSTYGAAAAGWTRGISAGLSDVALSKLGDATGTDIRGTLNDWKKAHPLISASEELSGFAGSMAVGGEALGAGAAMEAPSVAGRIAQGALRGGAEMSIYEGGKAASEAALANEEVTAQKMFAGAKRGFVTGLIGGAAFGALGEGLAASRAVARSGSSGIRTAEERASGGLLGDVGEFAQKRADVNTIKALGGSAGDLRTLEAKVPGGYQKVAQTIRGDLEEATGKSIGFHSRESLHAYAEQRLEEVGDKLGQMVRKLDTHKAGVAPDVNAFIRRATDEVLAKDLVVNPMTGERIIAPGAEKSVTAVTDFLTQMKRAADVDAPSFTQWNEWRKNLDKLAKFEKFSNSPAEASLQRLRGVMEDHFVEAAEQASKNVGESFAEEYKATKSLYQALTKAEELTSRGVARELANNSIGVRALGAGLAGVAAGSPVGGLAMGIAGKVIQDRGDMLAADLFDRVAGVLGARRVVGRADAAIESGVSSLLGKPKELPEGASTALVVRRHAGRERYDEIRDAITTMRGNPVATTAKLEKVVGDSASPKLTAAMVQTAMRALTFLAGKLPPSRTDQYAIQPQLSKGPKASDAEVSRFLRYANAVDDPTSILKDAKQGTLTRDQVEAVKTVYPDVYEQMRVAVMRNVIDTTHPLSYERKIQLGILLDIPTDRTLAPDFVRAMQASYSAPAPDGEPPHPNLASLDVASSFATPMQAATAEGLER